MKTMEIVIDESAGFCWGVVRTIEKVEERLQNSSKTINILGQIIHNPAEIERLENLGMKTITYSDLDELPEEDNEVIIRAHGEPPSTYEKINSLGLNLVDATCPLVRALQIRIKKFYDKGWQIIVFGKKEHAEVIGIRGVCNDECIVVNSAEEALEKIDFTRKSVLFSQTTMDKTTFKSIEIALSNRFDETGNASKELFVAKDTICKYVSDREEALRNFAVACDVVIFVAGKHSSNGKSLFNICRKANSKAFFIENYDEIDYNWFANIDKLGITGATSTPQWYLRLIKDKISNTIK
jgi:4-hydroxy-3-methylbut-2-enyl diphosphate reductase